MRVEKCSWKYGKKSPVMLMLDDFANKYMVDKRRGRYIGADWGGLCEEKNSFYDLISKRILCKYPAVKITLFLVVGERTPITYEGKPYIAHDICTDKKFMKFLRKVANDTRIEIAYHGLNHGQIVNGIFFQEWENFSTLEEAIEQINISKKLYSDVTGKKFLGGKYCGYKKNSISDKSIAQTGFRWWCRDYNGSFFRNKRDMKLDVREFEGVIDIPTTIDGNLYSLKNIKTILHPRECMKAIYWKLRYGYTIEDQIDYLLANNYVISIQEHTSPSREDSKKQYPNVVTDFDNLDYIFSYLEKRDVWYSTGKEIADYYRLRETTSVNVKDNSIFVDTIAENIGKSIFLEIISDGEIKLYIEDVEVIPYKNSIYEICLEKEKMCVKCNE